MGRVSGNKSQPCSDTCIYQRFPQKKNMHISEVFPQDENTLDPMLVIFSTDACKKKKSGLYVDDSPYIWSTWYI